MPDTPMPGPLVASLTQPWLPACNTCEEGDDECPVCDGTGVATLKAIVAIGLEAYDMHDYVWAARDAQDLEFAFQPENGK